MKKVMIREAVIYAVLLILLSLLMHPDLLSDMSNRLVHLHELGNYYHPIIYTFIVYILLLIIRLTINRVIFFVKKFKIK